MKIASVSLLLLMALAVSSYLVLRIFYPARVRASGLIQLTEASRLIATPNGREMEIVHTDALAELPKEFVFVLDYIYTPISHLDSKLSGQYLDLKPVIISLPVHSYQVIQYTKKDSLMPLF